MPAIQWIPTSRLRTPRLSGVNCENPTVTQDVKNGVSLPSSNPFLVSEEPSLSLPIVSACSDMNDVDGAGESSKVGDDDDVERGELSVSDDDRLNHDQDDAVGYEVACDKVKDESSLEVDNKST